MKRLVHTLLFILLSTSAHGVEEVPHLQGEYDPAKWPHVTLNLSQAGTIKDFFDSGLRPYRHPGLEKTTLEVKHLNLVIHLASGKVLPRLPVELINLKPFSDGSISTFDGFTQKLTLSEARAEMIKWLPFDSYGRTEADLDVYLKAVEADYVDFDDPYKGDASGCGIGWQEPGWKQVGGGPQCSVWFRKTMSNTHPLSLYFSFSWRLNRPSKDARRYQVPIPPPPGYEHISMKAPDNFGPDSEVEIMRAKGLSVGESPEARRAYEEGKKEATTVRPDKRQMVASSRSSGILTQEPAPFPWWLIAAFVAILVLALAGWRKWRKPKSSP